MNASTVAEKFSNLNEPPEKKSGVLLKWLCGFSIWSLIGLSFASRTYVAYYLDGLNPVWQEIYASSLTDFYLWGAASPLIFYLCRRYPIERENFLPRVGFYFLVGLIFTFAILMFSIVVYWNIGYVNKTRSPSFEALFSNTILNLYFIHQFTLIYWVTVLVGQAFEYYRQLRMGKVRAAELSTQLAQAQLTALKMQVHPHFLFNTLNSISALLDKDVEAADQMIARLSDFLRMTLRSSNEPVITLEQELEFLKTYLEIEKVRFQEGLVVTIDVAPEALDARMPNLILQPLIENAMRHGVARQTATGRLSVCARHLDDRLLIQIEDNGPGLKTGGDLRKRSYSGLGLGNTRARLEQFYGDDFSFEIANRREEKGTVVNLDIPYYV